MENQQITNVKLPVKFYRLPQVCTYLGVSRSTIWNWCKKGTFPKPIKLSENTTAWHFSDIEAWANNRIENSK